MKYFNLTLLVLATIFAACSKHESDPKPNNISVLDGTFSVLSKSQLDTVNLLMNAYTMTVPNFVPQQLSVFNRMLPVTPPHNIFVPTYVVNGYTFYNKLPLLNWSTFEFDVATHQLIYTSKPAYTTVNLDNVAKSSVNALKAAFATITDTLQYPYRNPVRPYAGKHLEDSILVATFGYYDLNYDLNHTYTSPKIIKAWKIGTKSGSMFIFIKDEANTFVGRDY
ncbi:hypothetical protein [Mucilaginibacter jinjuensis]|uniref:Uncharacterized protein n=1 Tax=Mucilaginibacter jinjuensis TaxID=1176721 RepID=A0ABY7TB18_9SPHI|nr:hypothetical protein [Mucilaginibacter jinjuensis]WCT13429.1 hypothetical protein PQO05_05710 [Mucilaginibacter jinjuensis]